MQIRMMSKQTSKQTWARYLCRWSQTQKCKQTVAGRFMGAELALCKSRWSNWSMDFALGLERAHLQWQLELHLSDLCWPSFGHFCCCCCLGQIKLQLVKQETATNSPVSSNELMKIN